MMRLILAAAALTALALPAHAQRLDTRVREVKTTNGGVECKLNANTGMYINPAAGRSPASATLIQRPVDGAPWPSVKLVIGFDPQKAGQFGVGANFFAIGWLSPAMVPPPPPASARLLLDGTDSGVALKTEWDPRNPNDAVMMAPEERRDELGQRILHARWIEVELHAQDGSTQIYRFDGLRIADAAETLSIIKFRCDGARAD